MIRTAPAKLDAGRMVFELQDAAGSVLGQTEDWGSARRMLEAVVLAAPGWEDEIVLVTRGISGEVLAREDIYDI